MTVARFAISFDEKLAREVRKSAGDQPLSAWLAEAARRRLRSRGLLEVVSDWESVHGSITDAELIAVRKRHSGRTKK